MSGKPFRLCNASRSLLVRPYASYLYNPIKRYRQGNKGNDDHEFDEKAPSLADEFKRVAEEKAKAKEAVRPVEDQGVASQIADKAYDGTEETVKNNDNIQSKKGRYKEHEPGAGYRRRGD